MQGKSNVQWGRFGFGRAVAIAYALGIALGLGVGLAFLSETLKDFAFMVTHSKAFHIALAASFTEYVIEWLFFPSLKGHTFIYIFGFLLVVIGQAIRTLAMITAAQNFSHMIAEKKSDSHQLVTHGIYGVVRHPSYTGWFLWSISTQLLLANPICVVAYIVVVWNFFKDRIEYEESTLVEFFGNDYKKYQASTPSGIPLVK